MKKNAIYSAIRGVIGTTTIAALLPGIPLVYAQESGDKEMIEEVTVTGSRIRSSVSDAPRPVSVVDRMDIELSGMESVADVLRNTSYNSFGSFREQSGSSFGQVALANLRGLGADRTAVLINGRRVPGNPITGSSAVDLNSIPLSAVERVEILTDSASAVYGADAIGGVINIIYNDDFEGAEFEIGTEQPTRDDAEADHFNFTFGASGDKTRILFSGEWLKKKPVFDVDRDYSKAVVTSNPNGGNPRHGIDTVGISSGGNTGFSTDFSEAFLVTPDCDTSIYQPISNPEGIANSEGCGFPYANISMQTGGVERISTYINAKYEVADNHEIYFENRFSRIESFGRYAPAVGFFEIGAENDLNPRGDTASGGPGLGQDIFLFHRFVGHGNRDDSFVTSEFDNVIGISGNFKNLDINYDFYARQYKYLSQNEGDTYVLTSVIEDLVASGEYNFANPLSQDPAHLAAIQLSSATLFRDIEGEQTAFGLSFDGAFDGFGTGEVGWAAGVETASDTYKDQYDNFREAGNVLGSSGNSSSGSRSHWATFGEVKIPIFDGFSTNIAVRYDDYDNFDSEASPQIAFRYQPIDMLTLRASWGEGFKAPNLGDIGQSLSQSFETVTDLARCQAQGLESADCPDSQVEEYTGGNPDLLAETTESVNFGIILAPIEDLTFSVDWYSVEIEDSVDTLDLQDLLKFEAAGTLPPGVRVNRGATVDGVPGAVTACAGGVKAPNCGIVNVFANLATEKIEGIDLRAQYELHTDIGNWMATTEYSQILTYDYQPTPTAEVIDRPGTQRFPEFRYNVTLRWSWEQWVVNYNYRYIDEHEGATEGSKYPSYDNMDINVTWQNPWGGDLSFGVRNLTDEDPSIDNISGYDSEIVLDLYDVNGRLPYISYKHQF